MYSMEPDDGNLKLSDIRGRRGDRLEVYNTVILAIATLAVAWCAYQNNLWNGIQTFKLAESNKFNRLAQQKTLQGGQSFQIDEAITATFVDAVLQKNRDRIQFILKGVRPELSKVLQDWLQVYNEHDTTAPLHPMVMPEYKQMLDAKNLETERLRDEGDKAYKEGDRANSITDRYSLFTVLFSSVMFLSAIATKATRRDIHFTLVFVSGIICIANLVLLVLYMPLASK